MTEGRAGRGAAPLSHLRAPVFLSSAGRPGVPGAWVTRRGFLAIILWILAPGQELVLC